MSNVAPESNKVSSPFESVLLGMETKREVSLDIRYKLKELKKRISGPEPEDENKNTGICEAGILPAMHFLNEDSNQILREIDDLCTELLELF